MQRRDFLRQLSVAAAGVAAYTLNDPTGLRMRFAQAMEGHTLVVLFQRGGCDGLNMVVPYSDPDYYNLRPNIAIAAPDAANPAAALDLDGFFGLHPNLADLLPIYQGGQLALLPAVHYPNASRSHFDGQHYLESAAPQNGLDGWLNRHLQTASSSSNMRAAAFGSDTPQSLRGDAIVSAFNSLGQFNLNTPAAEQTDLLNRLRAVYNDDLSSGLGQKRYGELLQDSGQVVINDLSIIESLDTSNYQAANGAQYPDTTLGRQLRDVAQLIKAGVGLEAATLSVGGWDTHSAQGQLNGRQGRSLQNMGSAMAAFNTDLGEQMNQVVVLTMTEFGRTAQENGSGGTDHGNASAWMMMGGNINGGIHGNWPGLAPENLNRGRYLAQSVDFRDVLAEVTTQHLGNTAVDSVIPDYTPTPLGVIG